MHPVDIRRLTLKQLYLAKNKSWCLLQEETLRERVRKPDDPLYDDRDFMELIRLIKGSRLKGLSRQKSNNNIAG